MQTNLGSNVLCLEYNAVDNEGNEDYNVEITHNFKTVLLSDGHNRFLYSRTKD
jgi:hypothetical protein